MKWLQLLMRAIFGDYLFYRIFSIELDELAEPEPCDFEMGPIRGIERLAESPYPSIQELAKFAGDDAVAFGAWVEGELVSVCWCWGGARGSTRDNDFWPLKDDEAKVVQLFTEKSFRCHGIGSRLIAFSAREMKKLGFRRLFARIWHSNRASVRALQKAGWRYIAFVTGVCPFGRKKPLRYIRRKRAGRE